MDIYESEVGTDLLKKLSQEAQEEARRYPTKL
jgi:hypothetical protein